MSYSNTGADSFIDVHSYVADILYNYMDLPFAALVTATGGLILKKLPSPVAINAPPSASVKKHLPAMSRSVSYCL